MGLSGMSFRLIMLTLEVLLITVATATTTTTPQAKPAADCPTHCGELEIPYPFGTRTGCYLNHNFLINCSNYSNPPKAFLWESNIPVTNITKDGELQIMGEVSRECNEKGKTPIKNNTWYFNLSEFTFSNRNKFTAIGRVRIVALHAYSAKSSGYLCKCKTGYQGNPYLSNGCHDVDECKNNNLHDCTHRCVNKAGSYTCECPKGYSGPGKKGEGSCTPNQFLVIKVIFVGGICFVVLLLCISWLYLMRKRRKLIKLKEKFFQQNGGYLLQQQLSRQSGSSDTAKIFTAEGLKKATKSFAEARIIGRGGYGTVYKGFLTDNSVVAIKKSKIMDRRQIVQFVNEVVVLSRINHRNVVKLLGCCLETEVPLLVYEFVSNGTLYEHIHNRENVPAISWETRLKIASETAGVLSYLHSAASTPIIHRDVKTTNILLDNEYNAKVSDFGASKLVPMDATQLSTMVQGTLGYLDPEYLQTSQLTEKSDVYSFGVVLVELLTGKKPILFDRPEEERSLVNYFLSSLKEGCLFEILENYIVNTENKEQLKEVAELARMCLKVKGEERPTMRELAMELDGLRKMHKHSWCNGGLDSEETEYLIYDTSDAYKRGDGSSTTAAGYDSIPCTGGVGRWEMIVA